MENFVMYNPTRVVFGKRAIEKFRDYVPSDIRKVLFLYGQGSIKRNGIYQDVVAQLHNAQIEFVEFSGIKANPVIEHVRQAREIARLRQVNAILAVGGGSVIDTAKAIAASYFYEGDPWDLFTEAYKPEQAIPIITVLTIAATGSEMNCFAVVQNNQARLKASFASPLVYPLVSFLDPEYTFTVDTYQTSCGLADIAAHALEAFFGKGDAPLADRFVAAIWKELLVIGPALLNDLHNYDLRARMMFASTMALNNTTFYGRKYGDWGVHDVAHEISLLWDLPHGAALSIVYPAWLKVMADRIPERISRFGQLVFDTGVVTHVIEKIEQAFRQFGTPVKFRECQIPEYSADLLLQQLLHNKPDGYHIHITEDDYVKMVKLMNA